MCLSIWTPKIVNFPFFPNGLSICLNGKLIVSGVPKFRHTVYTKTLLVECQTVPTHPTSLLTHSNLETLKRVIGKQCRPRADAT